MSTCTVHHSTANLKFICSTNPTLHSLLVSTQHFHGPEFLFISFFLPIICRITGTMQCKVSINFQEEQLNFYCQELQIPWVYGTTLCQMAADRYLTIYKTATTISTPWTRTCEARDVLTHHWVLQWVYSNGYSPLPLECHSLVDQFGGLLRKRETLLTNLNRKRVPINKSMWGKGVLENVSTCGNSDKCTIVRMPNVQTYTYY